jgi:hypothetical protein
MKSKAVPIALGCVAVAALAAWLLLRGERRVEPNAEPTTRAGSAPAAADPATTAETPLPPRRHVPATDIVGTPPPVSPTLAGPEPPRPPDPSKPPPMEVDPHRGRKEGH